MNAVERIQAAIDKLTGQRDAADKERWEKSLGVDDVLIVSGRSLVATTYGELFSRAPNADLIVSLHRTIDAQLAILEVAVAYGELGEGQGSRFIIAAKLLADAILGNEVADD